jgi:hypothetical protein
MPCCAVASEARAWPRPAVPDHPLPAQTVPGQTGKLWKTAQCRDLEASASLPPEISVLAWAVVCGFRALPHWPSKQSLNKQTPTGQFPIRQFPIRQFPIRQWSNTGVPWRAPAPQRMLQPLHPEQIGPGIRLVAERGAVDNDRGRGPGHGMGLVRGPANTFLGAQPTLPRSPSWLREALARPQAAREEPHSSAGGPSAAIKCGAIWIPGAARANRCERLRYQQEQSWPTSHSESSTDACLHH